MKSCRRTNRQNLWRYLNIAARRQREVAWDLIRIAWSSKAALAIAPLQDLLNLASEARMNVPGRANGNWTWRCSEDMLFTSGFHSLLELTRSSNRIEPRDSQATKKLMRLHDNVEPNCISS